MPEKKPQPFKHLADFIPIESGDTLIRTILRTGQSIRLKVVKIDPVDQIAILQPENTNNTGQILVAAEPPFARGMARLIIHQPTGRGEQVVYKRI